MCNCASAHNCTKVTNINVISKKRENRGLALPCPEDQLLTRNGGLSMHHSS